MKMYGFQRIMHRITPFVSYLLTLDRKQVDILETKLNICWLVVCSSQNNSALAELWTECQFLGVDYQFEMRRTKDNKRL